MVGCSQAVDPQEVVMDFLQELGSHRGGLLLLKTQLWWRGGRGWDGIRGRVCLLMDARVRALGAAAHGCVAVVTGSPQASALLLVDGALVWVWVAQADVELLS